MKRIVLTAGERLLIDRRREGQSQRQAAESWAVSRYQYRLWEVKGEDTPSVDLGTVWNHEKCYIKRLRAGIEQRDLAERIKVSRWWLCQMEHGEVGSKVLVDYWSGKAA